MIGTLILPTILGLPLLGAILVMCTPREEERAWRRGIGFGTSLVTFLRLAGDAGATSTTTAATLSSWCSTPQWIPGLGAHFKLGIDGISLWLVLLTTFLMPIDAARPRHGDRASTSASSSPRCSSSRPACSARSSRSTSSCSTCSGK